MIRLVSRATLLSALGVMAATYALAGVPNATNSSGVTGTILFLGGQAGGTVDFHCEKQITIRDAANNFVANSVVVLNFSACYGGEVRIASTQTFPGLTVNCGARTISAVTNGSGVAVFRILGASNVLAASAAGVGESCVTATADGVPLGSMSVATPDFNGANAATLGAGVNGSDLIQWNAALFNAASCAPCYRSRANFTNAGGNGVLNGSDLLFWNGFLLGAASTSNQTTFCP